MKRLAIALALCTTLLIDGGRVLAADVTVKVDVFVYNAISGGMEGIPVYIDFGPMTDSYKLTNAEGWARMAFAFQVPESTVAKIYVNWPDEDDPNWNPNWSFQYIELTLEESKTYELSAELFLWVN